MLIPRVVRSLAVDPRDHPRGQPHWSAASGMARVGDRLYVVADDEHHLACFSPTLDPSTIRAVRFAPGDLPQDAADRKKRKPDVEVLLHLPAAITGTQDLLVLMGSGSRPQRERVFVMAMAPGGHLGPVLEMDAAAFYAPLSAQFGEANIEAAYAQGAHLHLFQRANRGRAVNARITYDVRHACAWLQGLRTEPPQPLEVLPLALGMQGGVPFGITDASAWSRPGCVVTAVAEDTTDAYADGACVASMVGWIDPAGELRAAELLAGSPKVEGITPAAGSQLWMVTDADDPARASELLAVAWDPS